LNLEKFLTLNSYHSFLPDVLLVSVILLLARNMAGDRVMEEVLDMDAGEEVATVTVEGHAGGKNTIVA